MPCESTLLSHSINDTVQKHYRYAVCRFLFDIMLIVVAQKKNIFFAERLRVAVGVDQLPAEELSSLQLVRSGKTKIYSAEAHLKQFIKFLR